MRIESVGVERLNAAAYNPRIDLQPGDPDYDALRRSIEEFDVVEPLVWNERTGNLVGGHQRLKILRERGDAEAEVSVVDLDAGAERMLNVALNKIEGAWDLEKLRELLLELNAEGELDVSLTGFDSEEIDELVERYWYPDGAAEPLPPPDVEGEDTRTGQFTLIYSDEEDRQFWMALAGISGEKIAWTANEAGYVRRGDDEGRGRDGLA